jgi:hypothetical protein
LEIDCERSADEFHHCQFRPRSQAHGKARKAGKAKRKWRFGVSILGVSLFTMEHTVWGEPTHQHIEYEEKSNGTVKLTVNMLLADKRT